MTCSGIDQTKLRLDDDNRMAYAEMKLHRRSSVLSLLTHAQLCEIGFEIRPVYHPPPTYRIDTYSSHLVEVLARRSIRVYEISYMRESVRRISENLQGRIWSGKHFNSDSRLGPGPAFDLIIKYYLVS